MLALTTIIPKTLTWLMVVALALPGVDFGHCECGEACGCGIVLVSDECSACEAITQSAVTKASPSGDCCSKKLDMARFDVHSNEAIPSSTAAAHVSPEGCECDGGCIQLSVSPDAASVTPTLTETFQIPARLATVAEVDEVAFSDVRNLSCSSAGPPGLYCSCARYLELSHLRN